VMSVHGNYDSSPSIEVQYVSGHTKSFCTSDLTTTEVMRTVLAVP